jgi:DNA-binding response OmpR family regulator
MVEAFYDGHSLLERFDKSPCDLIITDIMMPAVSGYDLCTQLRKTSDIPIIMISAKDEEFDRVLGLELGSDDYISKPFSLKEITVKVRNMLRRYNKKPETGIEKYFCKDIEVIKDGRMLMVDGKEFKTTVKEYDLLEYLISNKNKAISRETLIEKVWGYDYFGDTRQLDHIIKRLRKKMLLMDIECKIETIWGYGYKVSD